MNDPLGLFGDEQSNDPLGLFEDTPKKERGWAQKAAGAIETGLGMVAGVPSQIAGGLVGVGSLMLGEGVDKANERLQAVQESNFGFGAYRPSTEAGQEYTENVGNILNYPVEKAGDIGGAIGAKFGKEAAGRYLAELPVSFAMEMLEPGAIYAGARGLANRRIARSAPRDVEIDVTFPGQKTEVFRGPVTPEQLNLFDEFEQRSPISPYQTEMAPDMWRVDENGIPIRADLSMEAQNLQNPLQRNLWGDEVDANFPRDPNRPLGPLEQGDIPGTERFSDPVQFRNDPEGQRGITEAMDAMDPAARSAAIDQTQLGRESRASAELEVARIDAEVAQWLEANKKPVSIARKGRAKRQSGAAWFGDLGETKRLQDLVETLPYRFPALEKLPNKETFTVQQLQQSINRQEVPEPERQLLQRAYNQVTTEGRTSANAKEFVEALNRLASDYATNKRPTKEFSDYGLDRLNRFAGSKISPAIEASFLERRLSPEEFDTWRTTGEIPNPRVAAELQELYEMNNQPGVEATTNVWETVDSYSEGIGNHFSNPNYFGHTRNFMEDGVRHVIEVQSDLVQRYKKTLSDSKFAGYNDAELFALKQRTENFKNKTEAALDSEDFGSAFVSDDIDYRNYMDRLFREQGSQSLAVQSAFKNFEKLLGRIDREMQIRANKPAIDTLSKNWFVRLIREELADAARNGETTVRFASADTMAKVEGWTDNIERLQGDVAMWARQVLAVQNHMDKIKTNGVLENYPGNPNELIAIHLEDLRKNQEELAKAEAALEEARASNQRFDPNLQGIYDRYNKDVTKYLTSIGGKPVFDDVGNSWIEVPVEKSRQRPIMFGQRGVLKIDWSDVNKAENRLAASLDGTFIPNNPDVAAAIEAAKKDGKDSKIWTYTQSGSTSAAMKTNSPIIKAASQVVQNAIKRADLAIRNFVFPAEQSLRALKKPELTKLAAVMKKEMFMGTRAEADVLVRNLSVKELEAYRSMRDLFDKTLDSQNAARVAMGKEPITAAEAYLSSRWQGDFRQPVYDSTGKLVWYLAANTKAGLIVQGKQLQKLNPGLVIDPKKAHTVHSTKKGVDLQSAYSTMLDILGRNDPAILKIKQAIEEQMAAEGESALAQTKHFEKKYNIRGFAGDRPWMDAGKDAVDMFQQQIQFAKNAFRWSELQKVSNDIKAIVSDPTLQETQPNNIKYIREYFKNAMGLGEADVVRALNDALRDGLGVSPAVLDKAVGNVKSFFILQKLAVSMGYTLSNLIQAGNVLPYLSDLTNKGIVGNPLKALPVGVLGGMLMGTSHYLKSLGKEYVDMLPTPFLKDALQYAEDNGVTARSVYDESPIEDQFSAAARTANALGKTMTIPETYVRSVAFMTYAQWLKDSGKFPDQGQLFQKAEELTNMSMVDYRETERPMLFAKGGAMGNFANTLQTFPFSFYNQWAYMLGEALKGQPLGLLAIFAFQYAVAGAMGVPGFDDTEKLYKWIKDNAVSTETWNKLNESPFFSDPKLWMMKTLGNASVYGALSDQTGLGMTSRVAAPGAGAMLQSPVGPITDIAGQVAAVGKAALDPTNTTKVAQAAMKVVPVGLQGWLEQQPFMEGITYVEREGGNKLFMKTSDLADRKGGYERTPEEQALRNLGIRSQKEVVTRDVAYATSSANQALTRKGSELIDRIYDASRRGDVKKVKELSTLYTEITGNAISTTQLQNQINEEFMSEVEKNSLKSKSPKQLLNAAKMQKLLESK